MRQTGIKTTTYGNIPQILANVELQHSIGIVVAGTITGQTINGRKVVRAGTPLYGNIDARGTAFVAETTTAGVSNAVGILLHDVDITDGNNNGTLLVFGFVNKLRIDSTTLAKITAAVQTALKNIVFYNA